MHAKCSASPRVCLSFLAVRCCARTNNRVGWIFAGPRLAYNSRLMFASSVRRDALPFLREMVPVIAALLSVELPILVALATPDVLSRYCKIGVALLASPSKSLPKN
jgi:hypothetical protein